MKNLLMSFTIILSLFMLTACSSPTVSQSIKDANDPEVVEAFKKEMFAIADAASKDKSYERIPLDAEKDQTWFISLSFTLWNGDISKEVYIKEGLSRFPRYQKSFEYVAKKLLASKQ